MVLVLAALVVSPMVMIYRGLFRAIRADERDIRDHGIAAQGQVIEIRCTQGGRNRIWIVTVEFRVPERTEPVHFQVMRPDTISGIPKPLRTLNQGQRRYPFITARNGLRLRLSMSWYVDAWALQRWVSRSLGP